MKINLKITSAIPMPASNIKKANKAFSLLEVIITVAILSTAIVIILRAFMTIISGAKLSRDITLACLFAEDKLWRLENGFSLEDDGEATSAGALSYAYELLDTDIPRLKELKLTINPHSLEFYTYKLTKKNGP